MDHIWSSKCLLIRLCWNFYGSEAPGPAGLLMSPFFALGTFPAAPCDTFSIQWDYRSQTDLSSLVWRSYGMEGPSSQYKRNGNLRASLWGKYWQSGYVNVQKQRPLWAAATRLLRCQSPVRHWIHCLPYRGLGKQATASLPQLQLLCCLRLLGPLPWSEAT